MRTPHRTLLYRHCGVGLLRAAAAPLSELPEQWPDPADTEACRAWLHHVWSCFGIADAIRHASPGLAARVDAVRVDDGRVVQAKQVGRVTLATVRYLLRAVGRHTPFGLFAGVAPVTVEPGAGSRWGDRHRAIARADTQWLADVIDQLEACPELLDQLDVVFTNLATVRGGRLEAPQGPNRVTARYTGAVRAVRSASASPIRFADLASQLAETFPAADHGLVRDMLASLVRQGFLITCLHVPVTVTDPLAHLIGRLRQTQAHTLPNVAPILDALHAIQAALCHHNQPDIDRAEQARLRADLTRRMRALSEAGRTPLGVDLRLDADIRLPEPVAREMEWAATALARLSRQPTGHAIWRDYYVAFCAHAAVLHAHLTRHGHAILTEVPDMAEFGWAAGHAHEIVLPLVSTRPPAPSPPITARPVVTNGGHGQVPGSAETTWLYVKLHTHPERIDEIIAHRLPDLLAGLDPAPPWWFVRYRSPHETDHLRLRLHAPDRNRYAQCLAAVGDWAQRLRRDGVAGRLAIDTYLPETGRYGHGAAMHAAEDVFVADSAVVSVQLRHLPATVIEPAALVVLGMVAMVEGFLGGRAVAIDWLRARPAPAGATIDRNVHGQVTRLAVTDGLPSLPGWTPEVADAWQARAHALAAYRTRLPADADIDAVLEALLHMHHNRAAGIDRDDETACRRLARQAALAWHAQQPRTNR